MPFTNDSGEGWDYNSGPDVYLTAYNAAEETQEMATDSYFENAGPSDLPLRFDGSPFTITDLSQRYSLNIWDLDSTTDDEFIGGVSYVFGNLVGEYPETKILQAGGIEYEVSLDWGN